MSRNGRLNILIPMISCRPKRAYFSKHLLFTKNSPDSMSIRAVAFHRTANGGYI
jgi:hypothetical protein